MLVDCCRFAPYKNDASVTPLFERLLCVCSKMFHDKLLSVSSCCQPSHHAVARWSLVFCAKKASENWLMKRGGVTLELFDILGLGFAQLTTTCATICTRSSFYCSKCTVSPVRLQMLTDLLPVQQTALRSHISILLDGVFLVFREILLI